MESAYESLVPRSATRTAAPSRRHVLAAFALVLTVGVAALAGYSTGTLRGSAPAEASLARVMASPSPYISSSLFGGDEAHGKSCLAPLDLAFLVDGSGSVMKYFSKEKDIIREALHVFNLAPATTHAALVQFSYLARVEVPLTADYEAMTKGITAMKLMQEGTRLGPGLQGAIDVLEASQRGKDVRKTILMVSDGQSGFGKKVLVEQAQRARQLGYGVYVVAVGEYDDEILSIIGTDKDHIFHIDNIDGLMAAIVAMQRIECRCPNDCSKHGHCTDSGDCDCDHGWEGADCSTPSAPVCDPACKYGTCVSDNKCECDEGYEGPDCSTRKPQPCNPPCTHGQCVQDPSGGHPKCHCDKGFKGDDCDDVAETCNDPLDVIFLLDGSGSIGNKEFEYARKFLQTGVELFDPKPEKTHVSIIQFSQWYDVVCQLTGDHFMLSNALKEMGRSGGGTDIRDAVEGALEQFEDHGRRGIPKIIIAASDFKDYPEFVMSAVTPAKEAGIEFFSVAVGSSVQADLMNAFATDKDHVFQAGSYERLEATIKKLVAYRCQ